MLQKIPERRINIDEVLSNSAFVPYFSQFSDKISESDQQLLRKNYSLNFKNDPRKENVNDILKISRHSDKINEYESISIAELEKMKNLNFSENMKKSSNIVQNDNSYNTLFAQNDKKLDKSHTFENNSNLSQNLIKSTFVPQNIQESNKPSIQSNDRKIELKTYLQTKMASLQNSSNQKVVFQQNNSSNLYQKPLTHDQNIEKTTNQQGNEVRRIYVNGVPSSSNPEFLTTSSTWTDHYQANNQNQNKVYQPIQNQQTSSSTSFSNAIVYRKMSSKIGFVNSEDVHAKNQVSQNLSVEKNNNNFSSPMQTHFQNTIQPIYSNIPQSEPIKRFFDISNHDSNQVFQNNSNANSSNIYLKTPQKNNSNSLTDQTILNTSWHDADKRAPVRVENVSTSLTRNVAINQNNIYKSKPSVQQEYYKSSSNQSYGDFNRLPLYSSANTQKMTESIKQQPLFVPKEITKFEYKVQGYVKIPQQEQNVIIKKNEDFERIKNQNLKSPPLQSNKKVDSSSNRAYMPSNPIKYTKIRQESVKPPSQNVTSFGNSQISRSNNINPMNYRFQNAPSNQKTYSNT